MGPKRGRHPDTLPRRWVSFHPAILSKRWDNILFRSRKVQENECYMEIKRRENAAGDDIMFLLEDSDDSNYSCMVEEVAKFCQTARLDLLTSGLGTKIEPRDAWLDDRSFGNSIKSHGVRRYKEKLTADELYDCLRKPV
jgi:hypothetical protein